jgi:Ketopantoate hydroxymethyltransferase
MWCGETRGRQVHGGDDRLSHRTRHSGDGAHRADPQSINTLGTFRAQGRDEANWAPIEEDARAAADVGAFSFVIEVVAEALAARAENRVTRADRCGLTL